jgi:hypothetical protein
MDPTDPDPQYCWWVPYTIHPHVPLRWRAAVQSADKSQISKNQGFSYYFCLMIEGSRSGSRRPKNLIWIRQIRIRNTGGYRTRAYLSGGGELGGALTPRLLSPQLLGGGLAAEAVSAAAVGQTRPAPHPTLQPSPAPHPTLQPIRLQPEPAGKPVLGIRIQSGPWIRIKLIRIRNTGGTDTM